MGAIVLRAVLLTLTFVGAFATSATPNTIGNGDILVAESGSGTIHQYSASGADLGIFASGLGSPSYLATDRDGNVYVSESSANRVTKYSRDGVAVLTIATSSPPAGIAVDDQGRLYINSNAGLGALKATANPSELRWNPNAVALWSVVAQSSVWKNPEGEKVAVLLGLQGMTFRGAAPDSYLPGTLYVTTANGLIQRTTDPSHYSQPDGYQLEVFAQLPNGDPAWGLDFDADGNLYVIDGTGSLHKFSPTGEDLGVFASGLNAPRDVTVAQVSLHKFSPTGEDLGVFASGLNAPRDVTVAQVPSPSTLLIFGSSLVLLAVYGCVRNHRRQAN